MDSMKEKLIEIVEHMPIEMITPFYRIGCYYLGYTHADDNKNKSSLKNQYILNTNRAMMMMNIILNLCSDGVPLDKRHNFTFDKEKSKVETDKAFKFLSENSSILSEIGILINDNNTIDITANTDEFEESPIQVDVEENKPQLDESQINKIMEADKLFDEGLRKNDKDYSTKSKLNTLLDQVKLAQTVEENLKPVESDNDYNDILLNNLDGYDLETINVEKLISKQLDLWGIKSHTIGYKAIISIIKEYKDKDISNLSINDAILYASKQLRKNSNSAVLTGLRYIISTAKFDQGKLIPILSKMDRKEISVEFFLSQILDFLK